MPTRADKGTNWAFWEKKAAMVAPKLGLSFEYILDARDVVLAAFSPKWLQEKDDAQSKPSFSIIHEGHPLVHSFHSGAEIDYLQICELAVYLKGLAQDPKISEIIEQLKHDRQFLDYRFQLAMAYRLKKAGGDVVLEPPTQAGLADLLLTHKETSFNIECTRIKGSTYGQADPDLFLKGGIYGQTELNLFLKELFKRSAKTMESHAGNPLTTLVEMEKIEKRTLEQIARAIKQTTAEALTGKVSDASGDGWTVKTGSRDQLGQVDRKKYNAGWADKSVGVPGGDVVNLTNTDLAAGSVNHEIGIAIPQPPDPDYYKILEKRVRSKGRQTRSDSGGRYLFIEVPWDVHKTPAGATRKVGNKILSGAVSKLDGFAIFQHRYTKIGAITRYVYNGYFIQSPQGQQFPAKIFDQLFLNERDIDLLKDTPYGKT